MTRARGRRRAGACGIAAGIAAAVAWLAWPAGVGAVEASRTAANLHLSPDTGPAGTRVDAAFSISGGPCPLMDGTPVRFSWDGSSLGTAPLDAATCSAILSFTAPEDVAGRHAVVASTPGYSKSAAFTETPTPTSTPEPTPQDTSPPATLPVLTTSAIPATPPPTPTPRPAATAAAVAAVPPPASPSPTPAPSSGVLDLGPIAGACPLARAPCASPSPSPSPRAGGPAGVVSGSQGPGGLGVLAVALILAGLIAVLAGRRRWWRRVPSRLAGAATTTAAAPGPESAPGVTWPGYTVTPPRGSSRIAGGPGPSPRRPTGG